MTVWQPPQRFAAMSQPDGNIATPPKYRLRWYQFSLRSLLILTLLVVIGLKITVAWTKHRRMQIAREWVEACLKKKYPDLIAPTLSWSDWASQTACPAHLELPERLIVLRMAVTELETPRQRIAGLKLLLETEMAAALPMLREAEDGERDAEVRTWELRLIGLFRDKKSVDRVAACLADPDARVRAAAADALGLIHCPAYGVPQGYGWDRLFALGSNPPVDLHRLINAAFFGGQPPGVIPSDRQMPGAAIELPDSMRATLETMMLQGATSDERVAAARALVGWPPERYRLRVAEWGVWINCNGQLKLVQSVIDEIPKFVHRTGNTAASLTDRLVEPMSINKPILHLTADRPLAVDLQVLIANGRPWFAFPRPDDFSLSFADDSDNGRAIDAHQLPEASSKSSLMELSPIAEGYPWIVPPHRSYYADIPWAAMDFDRETWSGAIRSLGLRWQSLIVSPQRQPWMTPPPVGNSDRYDWWERLRKVPSSWLSSQGESERFLYYDGPTRWRSPVQVSVERNILHFMGSPVPGTTPEKRRECDGNEDPMVLSTSFKTPKGRGGGCRGFTSRSPAVTPSRKLCPCVKASGTWTSPKSRR